MPMAKRTLVSSYSEYSTLFARVNKDGALWEPPHPFVDTGRTRYLGIQTRIKFFHVLLGLPILHIIREQLPKGRNQSGVCRHILRE